MTNICTFQFYRDRPGDTDYQDIPSTDIDPEAAVKTLGQALMARHNDATKLSDRRPNHGRLKLSDGNIYGEVMVLQDGTIERLGSLGLFRWD